MNFRDVGELCGYRVDLIIGTPSGDTQLATRGVSERGEGAASTGLQVVVGTYAVVLLEDTAGYRETVTSAVFERFAGLARIGRPVINPRKRLVWVDRSVHAPRPLRTRNTEERRDTDRGTKWKSCTPSIFVSGSRMRCRSRPENRRENFSRFTSSKHNRG